MTFIVKDAFKEQAKDAEGALQAAEYQFVSGTHNEMIYGLITTITETTVAESDSKTLGTSVVAGYAHGVLPAIQSLNLRMQNLELLIDKLPRRDTSIRQSLHELETKRKNIDGIHTAIKSMLVDIRDPDESPELNDKISKLFAQITGLLGDITKLDHQAFQRCRELKESADRKEQIYTYISYGLYGIGWSLALFGRLVGIDVTGAE